MGASPVPAPRLPDAVMWHVRRHREILRAHPHVRQLFGPDPRSAVWIGALGAAQLAVAVWVSRKPTWVLLSLAPTVGAVLAHALGVLIHEASHNLVFARTWRNKLAAIVANVPLGAPAAIEFRNQHLLHHKYLGDAGDPSGRDTQAPTRKEVEVVGSSAPLKLLSFTFGRFFYKARPSNAAPRDLWIFGNAVACLAADAAVVAAGGWGPLLYLFLSSLLAFGPHVLGARRISEHLTVRRGQPSNSYYGSLNRVTFDVGYHVEHHDFPAVPWRRLRQLHGIARESYDGLASVASWSALIAKYVLDSRYSVAQYTGLSAEYLEERTSLPRGD
jgi:sphingolipid 4-desaturase/C4-monooxygenase